MKESDANILTVQYSKRRSRENNVVEGEPLQNQNHLVSENQNLRLKRKKNMDINILVIALFIMVKWDINSNRKA